MDRAKIATLTLTVATVLAGGLTWTVYVPKAGTATADLTDAGATPTHVATCPVRISAECQARFGVARYEVLDFPVVRNVLADGGREVLLPPLGKAADCLETIDFALCTLATCASNPTTCAKWGNANPAVRNVAAHSCKRKNTARGFGACTKPDGGNPGEMNVSSSLVGTCETVGVPNDNGVCYVLAGDRAEDL